MPVFERIKIVCFGGATGMSALLSGLKKNPWLDITAIVTMFDSGGSSGVLRDRFGILPPSDIMRCLLALSEDEAVARKILMKRIEHAEMPGHTGGNLLLFALEKVYGNYPDAVDALAQVLSSRGKVVPVSLQNASLQAVYTDGSTASHEVQVDDGMFAGKIVDRLFLTPEAPATQDALAAIREADVLVVSPGSPYTSILPTFLPAGIKEAVSASSAPLMLIANLLTEGEGLRGVGIAKSVALVERYAGRAFDVVIANNAIPEGAPLDQYAAEQKYPILPVAEDDQLEDRLHISDLWTDPSIARHDSDRLAQNVFALAQTYLQRRKT
jgi:uncharacterized cofD-like protein